MGVIDLVHNNRFSTQLNLWTQAVVIKRLHKVQWSKSISVSPHKSPEIIFFDSNLFLVISGYKMVAQHEFCHLCISGHLCHSVFVYMLMYYYYYYVYIYIFSFTEAVAEVRLIYFFSKLSHSFPLD